MKAVLSILFLFSLSLVPLGATPWKDCYQLDNIVLPKGAPPEVGGITFDEEGKFYVFTPAEIRDVLGAEDGALLCDVYGVTKDGNFADESSGHRSGASILHLSQPIAKTATSWPSGVGPELLRPYPS